MTHAKLRSVIIVREMAGSKPYRSNVSPARATSSSACAPSAGATGLLWCSPVAPADGAQAEELVALAGETLLRYGFEPAISLTMITERSLACVISITYDRHVPGEDE